MLDRRLLAPYRDRVPSPNLPNPRIAGAGKSVQRVTGDKGIRNVAGVEGQVVDVGIGSQRGVPKPLSLGPDTKVIASRK